MIPKSKSQARRLIIQTGKCDYEASITTHVGMIVETLMSAKEAYYNGSPIMSDEKFDALEDELQKLDPENPYFTVVGAEVKGKVKVRHDIPMLSCDKVKDVTGVEAWIKKIGVEGNSLIAEPKIDGCSCSILYGNGNLVRIATRGDGEVGQDITHIGKYIKVPYKSPEFLGKNIEVRGELYLPKDTKIPNPENKPLRNIAVGLINRKDSGLEDLSEIHFVAYQVLGSDYQMESTRIDVLKKAGFETISHYDILSKDELDLLYNEYLTTYRELWPYNTDGLVLVVNDSSLWEKIDSNYTIHHHHFYNLALKPPSQSKVTILESIEWNVSRFGYLIPVAVVKPVILGGTTVTRCTLNNLDYVKNLGLRIGDRVEIERANDVIPYFKENKEKHQVDESLIPTKCPSCNGDLIKDGVHLCCTSKNCREQLIMQILHWIEKSEMDGISESFVRKLVENNRINSIKDLYLLTPKDFEGVEGFGSKKIQNALAQIEASSEMSIHQFIYRLGLKNIGRRAVVKLGINNLYDFHAYKSNGSVISKTLADFVENNKSFIENLLDVVEILPEVTTKKGGSKMGLTVCMTGTGPKKRNELIEDIVSMGYTFMDHVNKDTNILVCEDVNGSSSKLSKAVKLGVKLVSYDDFFKDWFYDDFFKD